MSLELALAALRNANRIDGTRASYRKDNPAEYAKVMDYLDGGPRPTVLSDMGIGLVLVEDERRGVTTPPPTGTVLFDGKLEGSWEFVHEYVESRFQNVASDGAVQPRKGKVLTRVEVRHNEAGWSPAVNWAIAQANLTRHLGDRDFVGWSIRLPAGFPYVPNHFANNFVEWHGDNPAMGQAPIHFLLNGYNGQYALDLHNKVGVGYNESQAFIRSIGAPKYNQWEDFVLETYWHEDNGVVRLWRDDVLVVDWQGPTWPRGFSQGVYPMMGYYRANHPSTAVLYQDEFKIGTTREIVAA